MRKRNNLSSTVRIQKDRSALLLDHPFFGSLLFRLGARPTTSIQTMATDGISLFYNQDFVDTLNAAELIGTLAHEVLHLALQHHTHRGDRNRKRWNIACDYAINPLLLDARAHAAKGCSYRPSFSRHERGTLYNLIEEQGTAPSEQSTSREPSTEDGSRDEPSQPNQDESEPYVPVTPGGFGQVLGARKPEGDVGDSVAEQARMEDGRRAGSERRKTCRQTDRWSYSLPRAIAGGRRGLA
jgi:Putative metallopeptidase domain